MLALCAAIPRHKLPVISTVETSRFNARHTPPDNGGLLCHMCPTQLEIFPGLFIFGSLEQISTFDIRHSVEIFSAAPVGYNAAGTISRHAIPAYYPGTQSWPPLVLTQYCTVPVSVVQPGIFLTRCDSRMSSTSLSRFGKSENRNLMGLTPGRVKPLTYKIDTCHFIARRSALLG